MDKGTLIQFVCDRGSNTNISKRKTSRKGELFHFCPVQQMGHLLIRRQEPVTEYSWQGTEHQGRPLDAWTACSCPELSQLPVPYSIKSQLFAASCCLKFLSFYCFLSHRHTHIYIYTDRKKN